MTMMDNFSVGDKVRENKSPPSSYIGKVEQVDEKKNRIYVRWHRGYASWLSFDKAIKADK